MGYRVTETCCLQPARVPWFVLQIIYVVYPVPIVRCTTCPAVLGGRYCRAVFSQGTQFTNCVQK